MGDFPGDLFGKCLIFVRESVMKGMRGGIAMDCLGMCLWELVRAWLGMVLGN